MPFRTQDLTRGLVPPNATAVEPHENAVSERAPINKTSIRVLELYPALMTKRRLRGRFFECTLSNTNGRSIPYEALSYTWGPPFDHQELDDDAIEIDGCCLPIKGNLGHALRRIRQKSGSRMLWIDAICIDQSDKGEKGVQVATMAKLYSQATLVLIWLGEDSPDLDGQQVVPPQLYTIFSDF